jgi:hypothetical protein
MQSLFLTALTVFATAVSALSSAGGRLLVVLDDVAEKESYGQFLGDIAGEQKKQLRPCRTTRADTDGFLQLEALTLHMRRQRATSSSSSTWAREHTTTSSSSPPPLRVPLHRFMVN